jgi:hypothetical protein
MKGGSERLRHSDSPKDADGCYKQPRGIALPCRHDGTEDKGGNAEANGDDA